jgi:hypothetical protein
LRSVLRWNFLLRLMLCSTFLWKTKNLPAGSKAEIQQCHNSRDNGKLV